MKSTFRNISQEKQDLVIKEAMIEFSTFGYEAASTNRLVRTLGISKGSLFKYFENKLDLYSDLLQIAVDKLLQHMDQFDPQTDSQQEQLIEYAELEFDFLTEYPEMYRFFYSLQKDLNHPELVTIKDSLIEKALAVNEKIYGQIGIVDDPFFRQHLVLVIAGYNRAFMDKVTEEMDLLQLRETFVSGLRQHINLIQWRQ